MSFVSKLHHGSEYEKKPPKALINSFSDLCDELQKNSFLKIPIFPKSQTKLNDKKKNLIWKCKIHGA